MCPQTDNKDDEWKITANYYSSGRVLCLLYILCKLIPHTVNLQIASLLESMPKRYGCW